jgi:hypothetical protein
MKKTIILLAFALITNFSVSAQKSLYEALEAHGEGAQYQEYWSVSKSETAGKYKIDGKRYVVTSEIKKLPSGTPVGFSLTKVEDGKRWRGANVISDYERGIGYPHIVTRHKYEKNGYVVIGDYILELNKVSEDGTSFSSISAIFIKIGGEAKEATEEPKEKKKMSFKEKMKAAKDKIKAATMVSYGPEHKKASDTDLEKLVSDYLKEMKAKQDANPANAKQKSEMAEIEFARKNKDASIKAYNDSIKATPEYKKMIAHRKWMEGNVNLEVKNSSGHTYWIGSSKNAFIVTEVSAGRSSTMNCTSNLYYYSSETKGSPGTLFYNKNSSCGGSVTLN